MGITNWLREWRDREDLKLTVEQQIADKRYAKARQDHLSAVEEKLDRMLGTECPLTLTKSCNIGCKHLYQGEVVSQEFIMGGIKSSVCMPVYPHCRLLRSLV